MFKSIKIFILIISTSIALPTPRATLIPSLPSPYKIEPAEFDIHHQSQDLLIKFGYQGHILGLDELKEKVTYSCTTGQFDLRVDIPKPIFEGQFYEAFFFMPTVPEIQPSIQIEGSGDFLISSSIDHQEPGTMSLTLTGQIEEEINSTLVLADLKIQHYDILDLTQSTTQNVTALVGGKPDTENVQTILNAAYSVFVVVQDERGYWQNSLLQLVNHFLKKMTLEQLIELAGGCQ